MLHHGAVVTNILIGHSVSVLLSLFLLSCIEGRQNGEAGPSKERAKGTHGYPTLSKPNAKFGFWHKLRRSIKSFTQLFGKYIHMLGM